jgi:hypothetical protein
MSFGCSDLRKRWDDLVGKPERVAVDAIRRDGKSRRLLFFSFYLTRDVGLWIGEKNIEVVDDGTPESNAAIKSGVVRVILDEYKNVKYPPLRQS